MTSAVNGTQKVKFAYYLLAIKHVTKDIMVSSINYDRWPVSAIPILTQQVWTSVAALQRVMIKYLSSSHQKFNRKSDIRFNSSPLLCFKS